MKKKSKTFSKKCSQALVVALATQIISTNIYASVNIQNVSEVTNFVGSQKTTGTLSISTKPQIMTILNTGLESLFARIHIIRKAQKTIDVESFIFNADTSGKIFTQELIAASKRGVKVRILVDGAPGIQELDEYFSKLMVENSPKNNPIEVKVYNEASILELISVQQRTHRKILIVDANTENAQFITGGRNMADEYFDFDKKHNFMDRDILVKGDITNSVQASFDQYWDSSETETFDQVEEVTQAEVDAFKKEMHSGSIVDKNILRNLKQKLHVYRRKTAEVNQLLVYNEQEQSIVQNLEQLAGEYFDTKNTPIVCNTTLFASDRPGFHKTDQPVSDVIGLILANAESSIKIENPYFMLMDHSQLMSKLNDKVDISIITNSLLTTDNVMVQSHVEDAAPKFVNAGGKLFFLNGQTLLSIPLLKEKSDRALWGTHAKTAVIDGKHTIISTFNADHRSKNINSELAIACLNNESLAKIVEDDFNARIEVTKQIDSRGKPKDGSERFENVSTSKKLKYYLLYPIAKIFEKLL